MSWLWRALSALVVVLCALLTPALGQDKAPAPSGAPPKASSPAQPPSRFECPGCYTSVSADAERCPECRVSFKKLEYECPKCKSSIPWDATRCPTCGLAFDAPAPGSHEKRSAVQGSMPAPRDFLKNPEPAPEPGMEVHGRSTSFWRTGREVSVGGTARTITRFSEELSLSVTRLGGVSGLSFVSNAMLLADRNLRPEGDVQVRLREAYLRYENPEASTQIQLGRQFVTCGVVREFVDGLFAHEVFGDRLGVEAVGGHPVSTEKSSPDGDWMIGGRLFFRGIPRVNSRVFRDMTFGISAIEERWSWNTVKRMFGFDFSWSPSWALDIQGHAYYDLVGKALVDCRFLCMARPVDLFQFTFDYRYIVPDLLLPKSSIFNVFNNEPRHEFEVDLDWTPTDRLKLGVLAKLIHIANDDFVTKVTGTKQSIGEDNPYQLGASFAIRHGQTVKGELGGSLSGVFKSGMQRLEGATARMASFIQVRLYETVTYAWDDVHRLRGTAEVHLELYDGGIYKNRNRAFTGTLTGGYMYRERYGFTLGGDFRSTPDFGGTGDVFARLEINF